MAKVSIVQTGDPILRKKAHAVHPKDIGSRKLKNIITLMKEALAQEEHGVAIAAPQVGVSLRLFIVSGRVFEKKSEQKQARKNGLASPVKEQHIDSQDEEIRGFSPAPVFAEARVFINPKLTRLSRAKKEVHEGCLSVRGVYGIVRRHKKVTLKALDEMGKKVVHHSSGLIAQIFQHEIDHLDGILYTDKAVVLTDEGKTS